MLDNLTIRLCIYILYYLHRKKEKNYKILSVKTKWTVLVKALNIKFKKTTRKNQRGWFSGAGSLNLTKWWTFYSSKYEPFTWINNKIEDRPSWPQYEKGSSQAHRYCEHSTEFRFSKSMCPLWNIQARFFS